MKPQTGILISAHSYPKQYIQLCRVRVSCRFTRGFVVKVPDIQQYIIYTSMLQATPRQRLAGWLGIKVSRASGGEGETDDTGLS